MVSINLSTGSSVSQKEGLPYKKGIVTIFIVVLLLGGIYGGMVFYRKNLKSQADSANSSYEIEYGKLKGESSKEVIDFQNRLTVAKEVLNQKSLAKETLAEMEKSIASDVYILSYELDAKKRNLTLSCVSDNFNLVAQQLLAFKKSEYFSNVTLGEAKANEDGKIEFEVELKIK